MKSTGKCLSERYVLNGIIESRFCDAYAYIFDYMFNFILYNLSLLTLGFFISPSDSRYNIYYHYRIFTCCNRWVSLQNTYFMLYTIIYCIFYISFNYCHYTYDFCIYLDTHIYYLLDFNISGFTC